MSFLPEMTLEIDFRTLVELVAIYTFWRLFRVDYAIIEIKSLRTNARKNVVPIK